jgi:large subunit ribosomal protein L1
MKKPAKKYAAALAAYDSTKRYSIEEASELVKKTSTTKFDSTVDLVIKLNVDTKQADQQIKGTITLPFGNGKTKKVLAITGIKADEAKAAGADFVGGADMLEKIQKENWFGFDIIVATPDMMGQLGKMGRILGPKGLMPNPKTGTVSMDIANAVKEIKNGKLAYKTDKDGNLSLTVAKASFDAKKIAANVQAVVDVVEKARPAAIKGIYVANAVIHTTMGPAVKLDIVG